VLTNNERCLQFLQTNNELQQGSTTATSVLHAIETDKQAPKGEEGEVDVE